MPGSTSQILPYGTTTPEALIDAGPGRLRHQLPGLADLRRGGRRADRVGHGHPPAHGAGDRRPRLVDDHAAARPRRQDLCRLRLPQRGADAAGGHQGRWRQGHVHDRDPRHRRVRGAVREARRLRDHLRRVGGHRGRASAGSSSGRSSSATTASRTSTRSCSPATAAGSRRTRTSPGRSSAATVRGFQLAADDPDAAAATARRPEPRRLRRAPELPAASQEFLAEAATCATRTGGRSPDAGEVAGLLGLPVRARAS